MIQLWFIKTCAEAVASPSKDYNLPQARFEERHSDQRERTSLLATILPSMAHCFEQSPELLVQDESDALPNSIAATMRELLHALLLLLLLQAICCTYTGFRFNHGGPDLRRSVRRQVLVCPANGIFKGDLPLEIPQKTPFQTLSGYLCSVDALRAQKRVFL